jgi:hypothetical protein
LEYEILEGDGKWVIQDVKNKYAVDLRARLFKFAVDDTFKFLRTLPHDREYDVAPPWNKGSVLKIMKLSRFDLNNLATTFTRNIPRGEVINYPNLLPQWVQTIHPVK